MGNRENSIEINGKRYDARTGKILTDQKTVKPATPRTPKAKNMDGFVRPKVGKTSAKTVHKTQQKSQTLMRKAVRKPEITPPKNKSTVSTTKATKQIDSVRLSRAQQIKTSSRISRFGKQTFNDFKVKTKSTLTPSKSTESAATKKPKNTDMDLSSVLKSIDTATSHTEKKLKKPNLHSRVAQKLRISPKTLNIGLILILFIATIGYVSYRNIPNIAVHVASAQAGFNASLPSDIPAGFALNGHITYKPGQITISYKSNSDERMFQITQSKSSWDSEALLENFVTTNQQTYQTYQDSGKTIYIYGGSNATWVDQGIWYRIEGNSSLNSDQLLQVAKSM